MAAKARRKKRLIKVEPAHAAYRFSLGKSTVRTSDAGQRETPVVIFSSTLLIEAQFVGHLTPSHNLRALRACGQPFARENFEKSKIEPAEPRGFGVVSVYITKIRNSSPFNRNSSS